MRGALLAGLILLTVAGCTDSGPPKSSAEAFPRAESSHPVRFPAPVQAARRVGRPPTELQLIGAWKPVNLFGQDLRGIRRIGDGRPIVTFEKRRPGLEWTAYDGCNRIYGRAQLRPSGAFSTSHLVTLRGCARERQIASAEAVTSAGWLRLLDGRLYLYDRPGELLGHYGRLRFYDPTSELLGTYVRSRAVDCVDAC